jgi:DNA-binding transcriptional ArsR family regulator
MKGAYLMSNTCCINPENVESVKRNRLEDGVVMDIAQIFKVLGDPTRFRMVEALRMQELCVGDLSALMEISQSGVSHQLRLLKQERIVKSRREGKMIYYSLDDAHIEALVDMAIDHASHKGVK